MNVPICKTRNSVTHFITETQPLMNSLMSRAPKQLENLNLSLDLDLKEFWIMKEKLKEEPAPYDVIEELPPVFIDWWKDVYQNFKKLPSNSKFRRNICMKITDGQHLDICMTRDFHNLPEETCICKYCGRQATWAHNCDI